MQAQEIVQEIPEIQVVRRSLVIEWEWSWPDSKRSDHAQGGSQQLQCLHWCFLSCIPFYIPVRVESSCS